MQGSDQSICDEKKFLQPPAGSELGIRDPAVQQTGEKPCLIWHEHPRRGRLVFAACMCSRHFGVVDGMPLSHAIELMQQGLKDGSIPGSRSSGGFTLEKRDAKSDDRWLQQVAKMIQQKITPVVAIEALEAKKWAGVSRYQREALICDVTGVSHLYDGEAGLCRAIQLQLLRYGLRCRIAVADTVASAWAFSRFGWMNASTSTCIVSGHCSPEFLGQWPIESLRIFPDAYVNLKRLGIDSLEELFSLPRNSLVSRFGKDLVLQIARILGEVDEPLNVHCPSSENKVLCELEYPTKDLSLLQHRVHGLVERLCAMLMEMQQGALRIDLMFKLVNQQSVKLELGLFSPTVDVSQVAGLINQKLEAVRFVDLVDKIEMLSTLTGPLRMIQNDLFEQSHSSSWAEGVNDVELNRFVNALGGRLGRDSVVSISRTKDPLPENAFQTTNLLGMQKKRLSARFSDDKKSSVGGSFSNRTDESGLEESKNDVSSSLVHRPSPDDPMRRPTTLLSQPLRLCVATSSKRFVQKLQSNVLPNQIQLAGKTYSIIRSWGPERIETGWWRGPCVRRDYYRVELDDGQWWWIFRAFPASEATDRRSWWMLHGYFD